MPVKASAMKQVRKAANAKVSKFTAEDVAASTRAAVSAASGSKARTTPMKKADKPAFEKPDFYLIKSEPLTRIEKGKDMKFSIDDLIAEKNSTAEWDGVRNYLARNYMRSMKKGDKCFFYHSNAKPSGIVGIVEVVREAYPDFTQFDTKDPHYDPKSKPEAPTWDMVDVKFVRKLKRLIPLEELKNDPFLGKSMALFTKARLSVGPVTKEEWDYILKKLDTKKA